MQSPKGDVESRFGRGMSSRAATSYKRSSGPGRAIGARKAKARSRSPWLASLVLLNTLSVGDRFRVVPDGPVWTLRGWRSKTNADTFCEQPPATSGRAATQPVQAVLA